MISAENGAKRNRQCTLVGAFSHTATDTHAQLAVGGTLDGQPSQVALRAGRQEQSGAATSAEGPQRGDLHRIWQHGALSKLGFC